MIALNILHVAGLYFTLTSPKFDIYSRFTTISMVVVLVLNVVILALLIIMRKYYERRVVNNVIIPLRQIEEHIDSLVDGDYNVPIKHVSEDEIGDLFNAVEDVRIKLKKYRDQEVQSLAQKKVHISGLMHDIATPVTRINGFASLIADGIVTDNEEIKRFAFMILQSTEDINIMLKNIATIEHYNKHNIITNKQIVNFDDLLGNYIHDLSLELGMQDVDISFHNYCKTPAVSCIDIKSCKRVLHNLINNSIKYKKSDERCKITVSIYDNPDDRILITVADNGIGVESGSEEMLFEMFYRGDSVRQNIKEGNGLGLFLSKQIILANDGEISAENNGNGLTMRILFRRTKDVPAQ